MALLNVSFFSPTLRRTVPVTVMLPTDKQLPGEPGYQKAAPYKTLYLLHGVFGNYTDWVSGTRVQRWAEENDRRINFDSPLTPEGALSYWNKRLDFTRNVIKKRPTYLYEMIQEQFQLTDGQMVIYFGEKPEMPADAIL